MTFVTPEAGYRIQIGKQRFSLSYNDLLSLHAQLSEHIVREVPPEVEVVILCVCERLKVNRARLMGRERVSAVNWARQLAMSFSREFTALSLTDIGHLYKRDHGTIYHACRRVGEAMGHDMEVVNELRQVISLKLQSSHTNNSMVSPVFGQLS